MQVAQGLQRDTCGVSESVASRQRVGSCAPYPTTGVSDSDVDSWIDSSTDVGTGAVTETCVERAYYQ